MDKEKLLSKKIGYLIFSVIGFLFTFFQVTGRDLAERGNLLWTGSYTARILLFSVFFGILLGFLFGRIVYRLPKVWQKRKKIHWEFYEKISDTRVFAGSLILIFLGWLPYFLAYYPAICTYDAVTQIEQIVENSYVEHHPLAHTLYIRFGMWLGGSIFGNVNAGIAVISLFQMLLLASAFALGLALLKRWGAGPIFFGGILLYALFFPFHGYLGMSMTKDTLFSGFFLLQWLSLMELLRQRKNTFRPGRFDIIYFISSFFMILFRNNGKYAYMVLIGVLALVCLWGKGTRKLMGRLLLGSLGVLLASNLCLMGLSHACHAVQGDKREMLSIPIQQLARCMVYHGGVGATLEDDNTMQEKEKVLVDEFLLNESYKNYNPQLADPVKGNTNTYVVRYKTSEFVKTYLRLLSQYPGDFINAALAVDAGYLYVWDQSHAEVFQKVYPDMKGKGYVQTQWWESILEPYGIHKDSKLPGLQERMEEWADQNAYLKLPLLKYLFVPGVYLWLYLVLFGYLLVKKRGILCIPLALTLGYYITLLLGPTVQLRYIYPVMIALPFFAWAAVKNPVFVRGDGENE